MAIRQFKGHRKHQGFTLVEAMIVLVLFVLFIAAVLGKAYFAKTTNNSSSETQTLNAILTAAQTYKGTYGTVGTYGAAGTNMVPSLITGKVIPPSYSTTTTTITNGWNGAITLVSTGNGYTLSDSNLPDDVCQAIVPGIANSGGNNGTLTVQINGAAYTNATTQCTGGASTLAFTSTM